MKFSNWFIRSLAVLGIVLTIFAHVSHAIMWPNWLNAVLVNWEASFSEFWFEVGKSVGIAINFHTTKILTVCLFLIMAITFSYRSQTTELTRFGFIRAAIGLILATLAIIVGVIIPTVSDKELPTELQAIAINSGIVILALAVLSVMVVMFWDMRSLARTAWRFLGVFLLFFLIFLFNIIYIVMESLPS